MVAEIDSFRDNQHYFAVDGTPVFLLGATHENRWYPVSEVDHDYHNGLRRLHRVVSDVDSPHVRGFVRLLPYSVTGGTRALQPWDFDPVDETFDLETFDPRWEERLSSFLDIAADLDIIVSLEVWDDWSVTRGSGGSYDPGPDAAWNAHPFNPANNRNYDTLSTETATCDAPFYSTVSPSGDKSAVLDCQQTYVDHLLALTEGYENILYSLSNESSAPLAWSTYWAEYVGSRLEADRFVGDMPSTDEAGDGQCDPELAPPTLIADDRYDFVDISQAVSSHGFTGDPAMESLMAGRQIADHYEVQADNGVTKPLVVSKDYANERPHAVSVI